MSAYRTPGEVEPTLTAEEEQTFLLICGGPSKGPLGNREIAATGAVLLVAVVIEVAVIVLLRL